MIPLQINKIKNSYLWILQAAARPPAKDEFDSDESDYEDEEDETESEEDSDFEDPDQIEVPGGGKSLQTIRNINTKADPSRPSTSGITRPKIINLTGGWCYNFFRGSP